MICKKCGTENAQGNNFCKNCGSTLNEVVIDAEFTNEKRAEKNDISDSKENKKTGTDILGIIACGLGGLGLAESNLLYSVAGIVLGVIAQNKRKELGSKSTLGKAGMFLGIGGIAMFIFIITFIIVIYAIPVLIAMADYGFNELSFFVK